MDLLARILGESPAVVALRQQIRKLVDRQSDSGRMPPVLIQGETGSGKGLVAQALHAAGPRARGPFVDVNCAAIPATLLESEMFGVERGAFTDARQSKPGMFQRAHRGTIFLDEIGLLPEALQAKLLKVIEERNVRRLGGLHNEPIDVWVLAATNENLNAAIRDRRFRADLYHRLAVMTVTLPPLRERGDDVALLARHFLARASADYGLPERTLTPDAIAALTAYHWPGNIRELSNVMERVALLTETPAVTARSLDLPRERVAARAVPAVAPRPEPVRDDTDRDQLVAALNETGWNITRAATRLGISRNTLRYRMEKHGLRPEVPAAARRPAETPRAVTIEDAVRTPPRGAGEEVRARRRVTLLRVALVAGDDGGLASTQRALAVAAEKIEAFGGRVQERGDQGLIAAFGLEPAEDGPRRAAAVARTINLAIARLEWSAAQTIHVAEAVVTHTDEGPQIEADAVASAAALLEALEAETPLGAVVATEAAAAFLDRRFDLVRVGGPQPAFRLSGSERSGLGVGIGGRLTAFVGRRHELELLEGRLEAVLRARGQVVGLVGEAGIGKSRLLFEFRQSLTRQPCTSIVCHCVAYGAGMAYLPVLEMLRSLCAIAEGDAPDSIVEKVASAVAAAGMESDGTAYLVRLLGIERAGPSLPGLSPEGVKARTFETLRQLLLRRSRVSPLVLVVEDLHWMDKTSEEFFTSLVEALPAAAILMIVSYRPGYRPPWLDKSYATQVALQPLAPEQARRVVESMLGSNAPAEAIVDEVLAKAEGNPFFLEELTRGLREQEPGAIIIPDTIHDVLLARIDRLGAEDRRLLHVAAIIGKNVPRPLLQAVGGLTDDELRERLRRLQAAEFLYESGAGGDVAYTFKHSLIQEVVSASLLADDRRALHAATVSALERAHGERLGEHVESLAHHALGAESWEKAVTYLWQAAERARSRSAHWEAITFFERALTALAALPQDRTRLEQAIDLRFDLRNALQPLGRFTPMLQHLREAETIAQRLGDDRRLGQVQAYITDYFRLAGDLDRALHAGQRAHAIVERLPDLRLRIATNTWLGQVHHLFGNFREAVGFFTRNLALLTGDRTRERFGMPQLPAVHSRTCLVWALSELGDFEEGLRVGADALNLAESVDDPLSLLVARAGLGVLHIRRGAFEAAIAELEPALRLTDTWHTPLWFPRIASALGVAYALSGRAAAGMQLAEEAVTRGAAMNVGGGQALHIAGFSETCLRAGGHDDRARILAEEAVMVARMHKERGNEAWALRALGRAARSAAAYREAIQIGEELGMRPLLARCRRELADLGEDAAPRAGA
jgi:transcriptional regulator with AAA-type ATPase domain/tetratricopeptide (TPR) repeat protein